MVVFLIVAPGRNLYRKASNNAGTEELLFKSSEQKTASDWSREGFLLFESLDRKTGPDIWFLPMTGAPGGVSPKPESYLKTPFAEVQPRFSPDGRFVAYASDASRASEVYVQPFPNPEGGK